MRTKIFRSLFIHIFIVWAVLNLNVVLPYVYKVNTWGNYLWKEDGTATTIWEYFTLSYYPSNLPHLLAKVLLFIPLVELNYWYLFRENRLKIAILNSFIIGTVIIIIHLFPWNNDRFENNPLGPVASLLTYAGYAIIYGMIRKYLHEKAHRNELQLQQSANELNALKAQLNPHFFFNGLNYLYGTALNEQAHKTADAITVMSTMMRYSISGMNKNHVPLADEFKFINSYLIFQRSRIPEKESIVIETGLTVDNDDQKIAPLLLLPFIENAFKYGISIDHPCFIKININVSEGQLNMQVKNRIIDEHNETKGNNTGIINTKRRLRLLYENNHSLQYGENGNEYHVSLTLKLT